MYTPATDTIAAQIVRQGTRSRVRAEGTATPSDGRPRLGRRRGWSTSSRAGYGGRPMGQPITVVEKRSNRPGVLRFEINRPLTGMGHERYTAGEPIEANRPPDELARRLFEQGGVEAVHIYDNMITVELDRGATGEGLIDVIRELFLHYR